MFDDAWTSPCSGPCSHPSSSVFWTSWQDIVQVLLRPEIQGRPVGQLESLCEARASSRVAIIMSHGNGQATAMRQEMSGSTPYGPSRVPGVPQPESILMSTQLKVLPLDVMLSISTSLSSSTIQPLPC
nr:hypothetical protein CFP56_20329 [Quercus suber]